MLSGDPVLTAVLDAQPDGALLLDADGRVRLANRRAADLLNTTPEALRHHALWPLLAEHADLPVSAALLDPDSRAEYAWFAAPLDRHLSVMVAPVPHGQSVVLRDDTARARRLGNHAELLSSLLEQLPVGTLLLEVPSGRVLSVNGAARQLIGDPPTVQNLTEYELFGAEHADGEPYRADEYPAARAVLYGDVVVDEAMRYRRPDGQRLSLNVSAARLGAPEDPADFAVVVFNDRSADQRRERVMQEALVQSEQARTAQLRRSLVERARQASELAAVLDSVPEVLYVEDQNGIVRANSAAFALFGTRDLEGLNANLDALTARLAPRDPVTGAPVNPGDLLIRRALAGEPAERELRVRHLGSEQDRLLRVAAAPIREGRSVKAAVVVATDLTDREQARALGRENAALERRVEERAERVAELNAELSAYAVSLASDLQEPLRRISGVLELVRGQLDDRMRRLVDGVRLEGERVQGLVNELATMAQSGRSELRREPVSLARLVDQVRSDLAPILHGRAVRWQVGELPSVQGDRMLLRVALTNVLHNALKFTEQRPSPEITVSALRRGTEVVLSVRDNGVGFDSSQAGHIFELFAQLRPEQGGAGVGLANVRRIVARHGGRVWAEGQPGGGAAFFVALPRT